mmetsp:Transcript_4348/g.12229  ORF Transcript_4348/g.12229 Transcript_4348/m.12229 type:complete len:451 (+) Transcript_4348:144-1496(+)|eukprot:CAMPEP_0117669362 /NCGR_PEP_ID=MMETSP0804-20121206/12088_1 /TAXON_ID=1074897 /ORGANISM="Tetraselmis astigmatica, Strain CCMP880" /LENGTH=450 /DNA_ID=CAMNT_0005477407 /DNA_START=81 /DNA_END=1433 /DNA_ORIENTATION=+
MPGVVSSVVIVDPLSTGSLLESRLFSRGLDVVLVWSSAVPQKLIDGHFARVGRHRAEYRAVIEQREEQSGSDVARAVVEVLDGQSLAAVMVGSDWGVGLEHELTRALAAEHGFSHLRDSGLSEVALATNKFVQCEAVRSYCFDSVKQSVARSEKDVVEFLSKASAGTAGDDLKAVVKPNRGGGSVGVTLCNSSAEVLAAFRQLREKNMEEYGNIDADETLLQECLIGPEYVVDTVSMDGEHKCVGVWKYEKRLFNGSPYVYYGGRMMGVDDEPEIRSMVDYVKGCLNAIGLKNGAVHSEVILTSRGPILVESNCRPAGFDGVWVPLAESCLGYSQISVVLDVYLDGGEIFASLPSEPPSHISKAAMYAFMRSAVEGTLKQVSKDHMNRIQALESYQSHKMGVKEGGPISKTVDLTTVSGKVNLMNDDPATLERDYAELNEIVDEGMFIVA